MAKQINVVYVEDDEADVDFVKSALKATSSDGFNITILGDGEEAIKFFSEGREGAETHLMHDLVLLDLNLPKISGMNVLKHLKASERLKAIPVVVLSTSTVQADVKESYRIGANSFISKPTNFDGYKETIKQLHEYWVKACTLPDSLMEN